MDAANGLSRAESESGRNVRLYLFGLGVSLVGDSAMVLVAGIWVKSLTGSSSAAALVSVCLYGPSLLGPIAGLVADRFRRRPLLVAVNLASALVILPLLLVTGEQAVWLIYLAMVGYGVAMIVIDPAESALFAVMLPDQVRRQVNGLRLALQEGAKLVAPLLGAGLFALLGGGPVAAADAATFVVAAVCIGGLRVDEPRPQRSGRSWRTEVSAGFGYLRAQADLRLIAIAGSAVMAVSGVGVAAQYGLVDALHRSPAFLGVLTGALGAGSIVAGLTSGKVIGGFGERWLALFGLVNFAIGNMLRASGWLPAALAGSFVLGFALPWVVVAVINLLQLRTPAELQGRVSAAVLLALFASQPATQLLGAVLIEHLTYRALFVGIAVVAVGIGGWYARCSAGANAA